ncbi:MAG: hypothetical protein ABEJ44_06915 [Halanaeroarchaeum sp.]
MDLEELRAVQTRERATDGLQELRESFYADVATYIQELREERDRRAAEADDPFGDPRVTELTDEIEVAERVAEAIYERRIGKLVKQASLAAAGMPDDQTGLTAEEQDLYTDLVARIRENKQGVLDVIAGDAPVESTEGASTVEGGTGSSAGGKESTSETAGDDPEPGGVDSSLRESNPTATASGTDPPDSTARGGAAASGEDRGDDSPEVGGEGATRNPAAEERSSEEKETDPPADGRSSEVERTTVLITSDVGEIFGVDGEEYSLYEDDVVELPTENATPLLERDAAEELE